MLLRILRTRTAMRCAPVASINAHGTSTLVRHSINQKRWRDQRRDTLTLFVNSIAFNRTCPDASTTPAALEIQRKHVRRFDCSRGSQTGADAFTPAREASEVVKANRAGEDDVVVLFESAIYFDRRA